MSDKKPLPGKHTNDGLQKGNFKPDAPSSLRPIQPPPAPVPQQPKK